MKTPEKDAPKRGRGRPKKEDSAAAKDKKLLEAALRLWEVKTQSGKTK